MSALYLCKPPPLAMHILLNAGTGSTLPRERSSHRGKRKARPPSAVTNPSPPPLSSTSLANAGKIVINTVTAIAAAVTPPAHSPPQGLSQPAPVVSLSEEGRTARIQSSYYCILHLRLGVTIVTARLCCAFSYVPHLLSLTLTGATHSEIWL